MNYEWSFYAPCLSILCNYIMWRVMSEDWNHFPVEFQNVKRLCISLSLPVGSGYWGTSAARDGERPDRAGQGRGAGLCLAGELQQRGSFHREPAATLQRKPHLCKKANFISNVPQHFSWCGETHANVLSVLRMSWLRRTLAQCWCQWTLTKSWRFTPSSRWSATEGSASMKYRLTCESLCSDIYYPSPPLSFAKLMIMWSMNSIYLRHGQNSYRQINEYIEHNLVN